MKKLFFLLLLSTTLAACSRNGNHEQTDTDTSAVVTTPPPDPCTDPAAMEKIREAISVGSVTGMTDEEEKEWLARTDKLLNGESGITDYFVDTLFMEHCILSVDCFAESMGAYPDSWHTYLNFNMNTGDSLLATHILDEKRIPDLLKICEEKIQAAIKEGRESLKGYKEDLEIYNSLVGDLNTSFTKPDLNNFYIKNDTITFVAHLEFPHFARGLSPWDHMPFSMAQIQPFLKKDGPLGYWLK